MRLGGWVVFNSGGPVDCTVEADESCEPVASLSVSTAPFNLLLASTDSGGWMTLSFAEPIPSAPDGAAWYHVMFLLKFNPLEGALPTIAVRLPANLPVSGNGVFTATQMSSMQGGPCHGTQATGTFTGTFRTRFAGWGLRTFVPTPADYAMYSEGQ